MKIKEATGSDVFEITDLFRQTVLQINKQDYAQPQLKVWSSSADNLAKWKDRIAEQYFLIAVSEAKIVGFASLATDGYLDFMYVHHQHQKQGIATKLYEAIEQKAIAQQNPKIYSEVSLTARPFFEKQGFVIIKQQQKLYADVLFTNFVMEKRLSF